MNTIYPLGHTSSELDRLDIQAQLFRDPLLDQLAANSTSCLEIGSGNGSNLPMLLSANPKLNYTGIDMAPDAVASAKARFESINPNTKFHVMDASSMNLEDEQYDLVFTKLVLWSIGQNWSDVLREAHRLLKPGGTFYAFEPCNHLVEIYPPRPALQKWMSAWDSAAVQHGLDPFIGTKVAGELSLNGFTDVDSKFFPVIAPGSEQERYTAVIENLKRFYMGPSADTFGLTANTELKLNATKELADMSPENLVMDALFVSFGTKPIGV